MSLGMNSLANVFFNLISLVRFLPLAAIGLTLASCLVLWLVSILPNLLIGLLVLCFLFFRT